MRKEYITPEILVEYIIEDDQMICTSPGVDDGCSAQNEYFEAESYSKQVDFSDSESIW